VKLSLFADEMTFDLKDPKISTKNLDLVNTSAKQQDTKSVIKNQ
jgi:hypothetical protein